MDTVGTIFSFLVFLIGLAVIGNQLRKTHLLSFDLKPNCLLTRYPLLFVHGRKSIFYFKNYWNLYPIFLAEHGYEVFHLNLPWRKTPLRIESFKKFISGIPANKQFHLVMDLSTFEELKDLIPQGKHFRSVTVLCNSNESHSTMRPYPIPFLDIPCIQESGTSIALKFSHKAHAYIVSSLLETPSLNTLGALPRSSIRNADLLLSRAQFLAEMDLREE